MKSMKFLSGLSILSIIIGIMAPSIYTEAKMNENIKIYVNNKIIAGTEECNNIFIPLRATLEALGAEVTWEESTGNVYFDYASISYVCKFIALNSNFPENKQVLICRVENINSVDNADYIQLHPMSADGAYCVLNDRIYLYEETGKRLFEALGCEVGIETTIKICNKK